MECVSFKAKVIQSLQNEFHSGWLRVPENLRGPIPNGAYVELRANGKKVICQVRGTSGQQSVVAINEWYRNWLGWKEIPSGEVDIELRTLGFFGFFRKLHSFEQHPDEVVRIGVGLGLVSVGLGAFGLALGIAPLFNRNVASDNVVEVIYGLVIGVGIMVALPILVGGILLVLGMRTLVGSTPKIK